MGNNFKYVSLNYLIVGKNSSIVYLLVHATGSSKSHRMQLFMMEYSSSSQIRIISITFDKMKRTEEHI